MKKSIIGVGALAVGALAGAALVKVVPAVDKAATSAINSIKGLFNKGKEEVAEAAQKVADELSDK